MMSDPYSTAPPDPFSFVDWWHNSKGVVYFIVAFIVVISLVIWLIITLMEKKEAKVTAQHAARDAKVVTVSTGKQYYPYWQVQDAYFAVDEAKKNDDAYSINVRQHLFRLEGGLVCVYNYNSDNCHPYTVTESLKSEFMNLCHAVGYANCPTP